MRLLVAAIASEIQAFTSLPSGWEMLVTGPGKLQAAVGLAEALLAHRGDVEDVLVVGTAGALDPRLGTEVHVIGATIQHDVTDLDGVIGRHISLPERIDMAGSGPVIATGDSFVSSPAVTERIRSLGATMVDMESYAYAWVAQRYGIPLRIAKTASDTAQEGAEKIWDDVVAECSRRLWGWFLHDGESHAVVGGPTENR